MLRSRTAKLIHVSYLPPQQYSKNELGWADVNAWQAGEVATHPDGTTQSAFDALDAIVSEFANSTKYPKLTNLTLVGHGGGGQLMQRYAVVGADTPENIHVRHIVGDPSSCAYFTTDRPLNDTSIADKSTCEMYNTWRYGFDNFTGTHAKSGAMPIDYFSTYVKRDVVNMVGYQDTSKNGDQYCMAQLQGGVARRDRNLAWWKYINTLARTNYDVSGFPGNFTDPLPDWSNVTGNTISHRLIVVENATHDAAAVFGGAEGRAALFSNGELPTGWRPAGWNPAGNGQLVKASVSSSSSATKSGSGTAAKSSQQASAAASRLGGAASFGALAAAALLFAGILIL